MSKGAIPVPYIIALILAIVVIAVLAYLFLTQSGIFSNIALKIYCEAKKIEFCFKNSGIDPSEIPGKWEDFAPECEPPDSC